MKTLFTSLAIILVFTGTRAIAGYPTGSTLNLHHSDRHHPMVIELDHVRHQTVRGVFSLNNLMPGRYELKVSVPRGRNYYQSGRILYKGFIDVPASSTVNATLLHNKTLRIDAIVPHFNPVPPSHYYNVPVQHVTATACFPVIDNNRYMALRNSIANRSFDSTRLNLAKDAVRNNRMNSAQVSGLLELLNFESSRLDLARFAYQHVADPENYFLLYDQFTFDSSVRQLSDYITRVG